MQDDRLLDNLPDDELSAEVALHYPRLEAVQARVAYSSVHDMAIVDAPNERFALKLYRPGARTFERVQWEAELHNHLYGHDAPVTPLVSGKSGFVELLQVGEQQRLAVMSRWAQGVKPSASESTYRLLGAAAAQLHNAVDDFASEPPDPARTFTSEVEEPLALLRPSLQACDRWEQFSALAARLQVFLETAALERGICHNDLTLDNVHVSNGGITVFDFDSAGTWWRAAEGQGVCQFSKITSEKYWTWWLEGYRELRAFSAEDEAAVPYFVAMSAFENLAWKFGLTATSVGRLINTEQLRAEVDAMLRWQSDELQ